LPKTVPKIQDSQYMGMVLFGSLKKDIIFAAVLTTSLIKKG
jgi:hypothetical protein